MQESAGQLRNSSAKTRNDPNSRIRQARRRMEMLMKKAILDALEARYEAQISEADATVKIYLENSVGIGEHPQHIDEVDKQFEKIAAAQEKLEVLEDFREQQGEE